MKLSRPYLELLKTLVISDLKIKYKNTILGFFWSLLNPLLIMVVLLLIFSHLLKSEMENYSVFLLLGLTFWRFFANGTMITMGSIKENSLLIQNIYFPREILVFSKVISALVTLVFELTIFFLIFFIVVGLPGPPVFFLILLILLELIIILGVGFALSSLFSLYNDVKDIWEIMLLAGFFLSPIIYPHTIIPPAFIKFYFFNPLARIISVCQTLVLDDQIPQFSSFLAVFLMGLVILGTGYAVFKYLEPEFSRAA